MHGVLEGAEVAAPFEDLKAGGGAEGFDVGDHLFRHVGIGAAGFDVEGAFGLGGPCGKARAAGAGVIDIGVGRPVDVECDAIGVEALELAAGDGATVVAVGIGGTDHVAVARHGFG